MHGSMSERLTVKMADICSLSVQQHQLTQHTHSLTLTHMSASINNWRAPWKNRIYWIDIFLSSAHHSIVFCFWCSVYWWKGSVRF